MFDGPWGEKKAEFTTALSVRLLGCRNHSLGALGPSPPIELEIWGSDKSWKGSRATGAGLEQILDKKTARCEISQNPLETITLNCLGFQPKPYCDFTSIGSVAYCPVVSPANSGTLQGGCRHEGPK